jgi:hypothetical protein
MKNSTLFLYRASAIVAGIGWFVSILANLVSGPAVFQFLQFVSEQGLEYSPMLDYWMKMAGLAFAFIGLGFIYTGIQWKEMFRFGRYFAWYQILSFISVIITTWRLSLDSHMYVIDSAFFLGTGLIMLLSWRKLAMKN